MTNSKKTRKALLSSVLALLLCVTMLLGTTFAWFTDTASTSVNKIQAGTLDVALEMKEGGNWVSAEGKTLDFVKVGDNTNEAILWEPGCTYKLPELRIVNKGNLALKYKVVITGIKGDAKLNEVIDWTIGDVAQGTEQKLAAGANAEFTISGTMKKTAGNAYQGLSIDGIAITVYATQDTVEYDSSTKDYDSGAEYSTADVNKTALLITGGTHTINKDLTIDGDSDTVDAIRVTGGDVTITGGRYYATGTGGNSALRVDGGNVTIKGGDFCVGGDNNCIYGAGGNITIEGGTFKSEQMYDNHYWTLNVKDYSGSVITLKGGKFYQFDPTDSKNNTAPVGITEIVLADGYTVVQNGEWYCVVAENTTQVSGMPTAPVSGDQTLTENINGSATIISNTLSESKAGFVLTSGVLNGNGNTLTTGSGDLGVEVAEGTIKNLTVSNAYRGIMTYNTTGTIYIDGVTVTSCGYAINTGSGTNPNGSLVVTNSTLGGWSSWASLSSASFTNCTFVKGSYWNSDVYDQYLRPYVTSTFEGCDFVKGMHFDLSKLDKGATVTFKNCTCNGVALTADNVYNYLHLYLDNNDTEPTSAADFTGKLIFN